MEVSKMSVVELDKLREQITSIDQQLLKLLAERQQCTCLLYTSDAADE